MAHASASKGVFAHSGCRVGSLNCNKSRISGHLVVSCLTFTLFYNSPQALVSFSVNVKILIQHTGAGGRRTQYAAPCKYTNLNVSCFNNNSAVCKVRVCYLVRVVNHQSILVLSRVRHPSCNADEHKTTMFTQLCVLQNAHHTRPKVLGSLTHICIELLL